MNLYRKNDKGVKSLSAKNLYTYLLLFLFFFLATFNKAFSQKTHGLNASNLLFEARGNVGFLIAHHLEMEIFNKHIPSFEINLARATYGQQQWEALYLYPVTGVSYWNGQLGSSETLGKAHALMPFISFPLIKQPKEELNFRLAAGLAYLTQKFDRIENYKYIAIGSNLNAAINFMLEYRWKPYDQLQLSAGLQLMHFSNGSIKTPNFGLNIPSVSAGAAFRINKSNPYIRRSIRPSLTMYEFDGHDFVEFRIGSAFGKKSIGEVISEKYNVMAGSFSVLKSISYKSKIGIGFDLSYDGSDARHVGEKGVDYNSEMELAKTGFSLVYELVLSRLSFPVALGFYTSGRYNEGLSYYKIGMQYLITPSIFASMSLKTHFARADYVAFGIGYRFKTKYNLKKFQI